MINSLQLQNVGFGYPGSEDLFTSLNFDLPLNTSVCFHGGQGSGRSTLFKILVGLKQPTQGTVLYNGQSLSEMSFEEFLPFRKRIGYTFDLGGLLNNRTILENLTLPLLYHKMMSEADAQEQVMELLKRFSIQSSAHLRPSSVPGRTRKAAIVARSLVMDPELIILDDPTTGLSNEARKSLMELLTEYQVNKQLRHIYFVTEDAEFKYYMNSKDVRVTKTGMKVA